MKTYFSKPRLLLLLLAIIVITVSSLPINSMHQYITKDNEALYSAQDTYNGWYRVFFTPWEGDQAHNYIIYLINNASTSVYIAAYSLTDTGIKNALKSAHDRGVDVKVVIEGDHYDQVDDLVSYGIPVVAESGDKLMHNKFIVIDHRIVVTGSANWRPEYFTTHYNNIIVVCHPEIAENYELEFNEMFVNHIFHGGDPTPQPVKQVYLNGSLVTVETYFSPDDTPGSKLENLIYSANESVYFMTYAFTLDYLADALSDKAYEGARVAGVIDYSQVNDPNSVYSTLVNRGLMISHGRTGSQYVHHKTFIVDDIVWTGSMNPSVSGTTSNDENSIVIHDQRLAEIYREAFDRLFRETSLVVNVNVDYNGEPITGALVEVTDNSEDYTFSTYTFNGTATAIIPRGDAGDSLYIRVSYRGSTTVYSGTASSNPYTVSIQSPQPPLEQDHLVINEINVRGNWWIEIYNQLNQQVNIGSYSLTDRNYEVNVYEGKVTIPSGATIEPHGFIVIAYRGDLFRQEYGFNPDYEVVDTLASVPQVITEGNFTPNKLGDEIELLDPGGDLVDLVYYGSSWFPQQYAAPLPDQYYTIGRTNSTTDTDVPSADFALTVPTPGNYNTVLPPPVPEPLYQLVIISLAIAIVAVVLLARFAKKNGFLR